MASIWDGSTWLEIRDRNQPIGIRSTISFMVISLEWAVTIFKTAKQPITMFSIQNKNTTSKAFHPKNKTPIAGMTLTAIRTRVEFSPPSWKNRLTAAVEVGFVSCELSMKNRLSLVKHNNDRYPDKTAARKRSRLPIHELPRHPRLDSKTRSAAASVRPSDEFERSPMMPLLL